MGRSIYWKLYFVENVLRIIINSVLSVEIRPDWWEVAVDGKIKKTVKGIRDDYLASPLHTYPGKHGIYYVYLRNLGDIMRNHADLFVPVIPDIDEWITKIEEVRLPRNVVGHMNFLSKQDQEQIEVLYDECKALITKLQNTELVLKIPEL